MNARRSFLKRAGALGAAGAGVGALTGLPGTGSPMLADLQRIVALAGDALIGSARAQTVDDYRCLVCIFMFGGNDSNNLIVPTDGGRHALYSRARGPLALTQPSLLPVTAANGGAPYGFHPAFANVQKLFTQNKAAVVANVGPLVVPLTKAALNARSVPVPSNLYSHSDQQSQWQSSISDGSGRTGWAGRIGDLLQATNSNRGATCVSLAGNNLWETGTTLNSYKVSPSGANGFSFYKPASGSDPLSISITEMLQQSRTGLFDQAWLNVIQKSLENQRALSSALAGQSSAGTFPNTGLGRQLRMAAQLIAARGTLGVNRQTIFCSIGGFDTHSGDQLQIQQRLFAEIDGAVSAFYNATVALGVAEKVTTFTASDFSRTLQSNGGGSDHAWGGHHLVIGGAVKGGNLYGSFPDLTLGGPDDSSQQGRWIPTTSVDQYGATMARWLGVAASEMTTAFPAIGGFATADLGFMNP
jgi:uncharacterized protein (DUF1501 family)